MKRLLIVLALMGAFATLPSAAQAGWRHRCRDCYGAYYGGPVTPYYYGGYYSSAYRWGGYYPYGAYYGGVGYGYPGYGATWGYGFGGY